MVAFALLRTSSILIGLIAPVVLAGKTPLGHKKKLFSVSPGNRVVHKDNRVQVLSSSGTVLHSTNVTITWNADVQVADGTNAYALWRNNDSISSFATNPISLFTTKWTVPPHPTTNNDQVLFLFNALYSTISDVTLLPSLQYGRSAAGGGKHWSLVTWYILEDIAFHTAPVKVPAGASLEGILSLTVTSNTSYLYEASFANVQNTNFSLSLSPPLAFDVAEERVESWGLTGPSDYPPFPTDFYGINLRLLNDTNPPVHWIAHNDTENGVTVTVDADGATNAAVTISYPAA